MELQLITGKREGHKIFMFYILNGYRAGNMLETPANYPHQWRDKASALRWAKEIGYTVK